MKKFITGVITGAILTSTIALAVSYVAEPASFKVLVNGKEFTSDPPAMVINDRTYLPLRAVGDALGVPVEWNEELRQAEVGTYVPASTNTNVSIDVQSNDKWKMTYKGCKTYDEISSSYDSLKAGEGKEFVILSFEIENISNEKDSFSFVFLENYIDEIKIPQTILARTINDEQQITATTLEPGKKQVGYFAYEVDKSWEKIDIVYDEDILHQDTENVLRFTIKR